MSKLTRLEKATCHEGDPCVHCKRSWEDQRRLSWRRSHRLPTGLCRERTCSVMRCHQPAGKDDRPDYHKFCRLHVWLFAAQDRLAKSVKAFLLKAGQDGRVL